MDSPKTPFWTTVSPHDPFAAPLAHPESGKKRAHKLKKNPRDTGRVSLGHPAGQTGVYRPVSQGFPVVYYRKTQFVGTPAGCPRDTRPSRGFSENLCDFFLCAFLLSNTHFLGVKFPGPFLAGSCAEKPILWVPI